MLLESTQRWPVGGMPVVVGGVVEVAPAPWPEAPTVPGLPAPVPPTAPPPVMPLDVPLDMEPLAVDPVLWLAPVSAPPVPVALHAASDNAAMPAMRMP